MIRPDVPSDGPVQSARSIGPLVLKDDSQLVRTTWRYDWLNFPEILASPVWRIPERRSRLASRSMVILPDHAGMTIYMDTVPSRANERSSLAELDGDQYPRNFVGSASLVGEWRTSWQREMDGAIFDMRIR